MENLQKISAQGVDIQKLQTAVQKHLIFNNVILFEVYPC